MLTGEAPFKGANPFAVLSGSAARTESRYYARTAGDYLPRDRARPIESLCTRAMAWDLLHQDQVGVSEDRPELRNWKQRRSPLYRKVLFHIMLALIPVVVFSLLLYVAKHT